MLSAKRRRESGVLVRCGFACMWVSALIVVLAVVFAGCRGGDKGKDATATGTVEPTLRDAGSRKLLVRSEAPGGWSLKLDVNPFNPDLHNFHISSVSSTGQALLVAWVQSEDYRRLELSTAGLIGMDGTLLVSLILPGLMPIDADVSPNGRLVALIAGTHSSPNQPITLLVFDDKGTQMLSRKASPERELLVGNDWIAFWSSPLAAAHQEQDPPVSQTAMPVEFIRLDGTPLKPPDRIRGALEKTGEGLAVVADGQLSTYRTDLTRRGRAKLGFPVGIPYAAADGSLVAVAEYYIPGREAKTKRLLLFDGDAKRLGSLTLQAALGIQAAVSPDGTAVLATPASLGSDGPELIVQDSPVIDLVLVDRTGKIRWKHAIKRRAKFEYVAYLAVSSGGRRAALAFKAEGKEDLMMVLNEKGEVLYRESPGKVRGLWFDPSGESIFIATCCVFSRLRVDKLVKQGTGTERTN